MTREQRPAPHRHAQGDLTSLTPEESLPELPVVPLRKPHSGTAARENPRYAPRHHEMRDLFPAWHGEQNRVLSPDSTGGLTLFRPLT